MNCPGVTEIPELGIRVICEGDPCGTGTLVLRSRQPGDTIRLACGSKRLKKLYSDEKIPAGRRERILVISDDAGVVQIPELNLCRYPEAPSIRMETL